MECGGGRIYNYICYYKYIFILDLNMFLNIYFLVLLPIFLLSNIFKFLFLIFIVSIDPLLKIKVWNTNNKIQKYFLNRKLKNKYVHQNIFQIVN